MFKKVLAVLMCIALLVPALMGCSGKESNSDTTTGSSQEELLITRWASVYEEEAFKAWGNKFMEQNPDIKLTWKFNSYSEYFQKVQYDLLDDAAGDVIFLSTWAWNTYENSSVLVDLNSVPELAEAIEGLTEASKEQFIKKGGTERLAIPIGTTTRRPAISIDDFKKAGYTDDQLTKFRTRADSFTAKELTTVLGDITDELGKKYSTKFDVTEVIFLMAASAGAPIINNKTNAVDVDCEAGRAAIKEAVKFMQSGYQVPFQQAVNGGLGGTFDSSMLATGQNTVLTSYTGPWAFNMLENSGKSIISIPTIKAENGKDTMLVTYNNLAVPKTSKKQDAAFKFIKWAVSKEGQLDFAKFSDLPVNKEAYQIVTGGQTSDFSEQKFGAFNVGAENAYYMQGLSPDFASAFSSALSNLLNTSYKTGNGYDDVDEAALDAAVAAFCTAIKKAESKI